MDGEAPQSTYLDNDGSVRRVTPLLATENQVAPVEGTQVAVTWPLASAATVSPVGGWRDSGCVVAEAVRDLAEHPLELHAATWYEYLVFGASPASTYTLPVTEEEMSIPPRRTRYHSAPVDAFQFTSTVAAPVAVAATDVGVAGTIAAIASVALRIRTVTENRTVATTA